MLVSICTVLLEPNNLLFVSHRTNTLLEKVAAAVEQSAFYSALWGSILTSPAVRLPGVSFVLLHLNRKLSMEDQLYVIGSDIELMVHEAQCIEFTHLAVPVRVQKETINRFTSFQNINILLTMLRFQLVSIFKQSATADVILVYKCILSCCTVIGPV